MFKIKKEFKQLQSVIYPAGQEDNLTLGQDNRLFRSLRSLFEAFYIYTRPHRELYLVGGCVRDMLLGREPKDYDLCTNATPDEVKQICQALHLKTFDSGIKHGTLTIIDDFFGQSYEITTYRVDGKYTDGRHPDSVEFVGNLEEDLKRRDFTINSFAYNLLEKELVMLDESYLKDLEYGIIRTVGKAEERYNEDALRMLRALRFSAQLNFSIEAETFAAIKTCAPLLEKISKERIRDEVTKIIMSDNPQALELFIVAGLEPYAFGFTPLGDILACPHQNPWHYTDVFHHTIDVIKRVPKTFELRWAALLHDTGKPATKRLKEGTVDHYNYHGHNDYSAEIALRLMEVLKFSNEQKDLVYKFVKYHDEPLAEVRNAKFKQVMYEIGVDHFKDFIKLRFADAMAHNLTMNTKYAIDFISKVYARFDKISSEQQPLSVKDLDINGYDLMNLGFEGKAIGDCLQKLLEAVLEDSELNKKEKLLEIALQIKQDNV